MDLIHLFTWSTSALGGQRGGDKESEAIGNVTRTFADLMSHSKEIKEDNERLSFILNIYLRLGHFLGYSMPFDEFLEIAGKVCINSHLILDANGHDLGLALYLGLSGVNHSCCPNAYPIFEGPNLLLCSSEDNNDFDISKVFTHYIDVLYVKSVRQKTLLEKYYFVCECAWCKDDNMDEQMMSIQCENADCKEPVYIQKDECTKCGTRVKPNKRNHALAISEELAESISKNGELGTLLDVMNRAEKLLHPLNVTYIKGADKAFNECVLQHNFQRALPHGLIALQGFRTYSKNMYHLLGNHMVAVAEIQFLVGNYQESVIQTTEATDMMTKLHGQGRKYAAATIEKHLLAIGEIACQID